MKNRIAILPGSFDPPIYGHISLIEAALGQDDIDHVVAVIVRNPTKKGRLLKPATAARLLKKMLPPAIADRVTVCACAQKPVKLATQFNAVAVIRGKRDIDPPRKTFLHETAVAAYFATGRLIRLRKPLQIKWLTSPVQGMSSTRLRHVLFSKNCTQKKLETFVPPAVAALLMQAKIRCPDVSKQNNAAFNKELEKRLAAPKPCCRPRPPRIR